MSREDIKPGMAFRSAYVEGDIFLFAFPSSIIEGDGLYRRFNRAGAFIEPKWYRFPANSPFLHRAKEFDFVG